MAQTIIVADDHPLFRAALKQAVSQAVPDAETVEVDSIKALQAAVESHPDADLVLLDLNMPGAHGFSGLVFMRGQYPGLPVVVVSGSEELQVMRRSIDYGASGFIPKSAPLPTITEAIQAVWKATSGCRREWPTRSSECIQMPPTFPRSWHR